MLISNGRLEFWLIMYVFSDDYESIIDMCLRAIKPITFRSPRQSTCTFKHLLHLDTKLSIFPLEKIFILQNMCSMRILARFTAMSLVIFGCFRNLKDPSNT